MRTYRQCICGTGRIQCLEQQLIRQAKTGKRQTRIWGSSENTRPSSLRINLRFSLRRLQSPHHRLQNIPLHLQIHA